MAIVISNILESNTAIFHDEGLQVYDSIEEGFKRGDQVVLSFVGIKHCSTQFLNACIGKLYLTYSKSYIETSLIIEGADNKMLMASIKKVIENALNAEKYNQILDEVLAEV